ncbi:MAG: hypothetical protein HC769_07805 [Cyanobacteria bacterium CRU_2_1]|nr:hypothetical protein [Cyanobacteria bacterium RU_5_0]NJR58754.1 hypothetical protein [Cyanobacteria bacterium CRU_2_1]
MPLDFLSRTQRPVCRCGCGIESTDTYGVLPAPIGAGKTPTPPEIKACRYKVAPRRYPKCIKDDRGFWISA